MRITHRRLRRIIREAIADSNLAVTDYREWATDYMGSPSGANSSSVLATYAVENDLDEPDWSPVALAMGIDPLDVEMEIARQQDDPLQEIDCPAADPGADPTASGTT